MLIRSRSHIFDGKDLTKETAAFQLCDIEDPMLMEMINDPNNMQEECNVSSNFLGHAQSTQLLYKRNVTVGTPLKRTNESRWFFVTNSFRCWKATSLRTRNVVIC